MSAEPQTIPFEIPEKPAHVSRVTLKGDPHRACKHLAVEVDAETRIVKCLDCGTKVDPIDFLIAWSKADKDIDCRLKMIQDVEARLNAREERARERRRKKL